MDQIEGHGNIHLFLRFTIFVGAENNVPELTQNYIPAQGRRDQW